MRDNSVYSYATASDYEKEIGRNIIHSVNCYTYPSAAIAHKVSSLNNPLDYRKSAEKKKPRYQSLNFPHTSLNHFRHTIGEKRVARRRERSELNGSYYLPRAFPIIVDHRGQINLVSRLCRTIDARIHPIHKLANQTSDTDRKRAATAL